MINGGVIAGISTAIVIAVFQTIIVVLLIAIFITRRRAKINTSIHLTPLPDKGHHHHDDDIESTYGTTIPLDTNQAYGTTIPLDTNRAYGTAIPLDTNQAYGIVNTEDHIYASPNEEENKPHQEDYDYIY